jgi:hypothetical protein
MNVVNSNPLKNKLEEEARYLVDSFFADISKSLHEEDVVKQQSRFNGHLSIYLERVKNLVLNEIRDFRAEQEITIKSIKKKRDQIVRKMFESLEKD